MQLPADVRMLVPLAPDVRDAFYDDYSRRKKSVGWAYVLWGILGGHYAYLGKRREQIVFFLTLGGLGAWWLVDAIRIPSLVVRANEDLARTLVCRHRALTLDDPRHAPAPSSASQPRPGTPARDAGRPVLTGSADRTPTS